MKAPLDSDNIDGAQPGKQGTMDGKRADELGRNLSVACEWNGLDILLVAMAALTDANFHAEVEVLEKMYSTLNASLDELSYELVITRKAAQS